MFSPGFFEFICLENAGRIAYIVPKTGQKPNILCEQKKMKKIEKNLKKGVDILFAWCYINKAVA